MDKKTRIRDSAALKAISVYVILDADGGAVARIFMRWNANAGRMAVEVFSTKAGRSDGYSSDVADALCGCKVEDVTIQRMDFPVENWKDGDPVPAGAVLKEGRAYWMSWVSQLIANGFHVLGVL